MDERQRMTMLAEAAGAAGSAVVTIAAAAGESAPLVVAGVGAVFVFAAMLVRSILSQQREATEAVELEKDQSHYLRWENDTLRYRYHEREVDPGPYVPRRTADEKPARPAPEPAP